jgi:hypothetical protein
MTEPTPIKRESLTIREKYILMRAIDEHYTISREPDSGFAGLVTAQYGIEVAPSTVRHYREGLGIPQNKSESAAALRARVLELERQLATKLQEPA